jgi:TPR repeat protein/thiamine monophosphate synthase
MNEGIRPAAPRLYVFAPTASHAAGDLAEALRAVAAAAVLLRLGEADEPAMVEEVKRIAPPVQDAGTALLLDGRPELAARAGADGAHLSGPDALKAALPLLKPARIAGAGRLHSRHDAMVAGEAGADYVMFGEPDASGHCPSLGAVIDRVEWWAELFEIPCVAYAARLDDIEELAAAGADFIALGEALFDDPRGIGTAAVDAAGRLKILPQDLGAGRMTARSSLARWSMAMAIACCAALAFVPPLKAQAPVDVVPPTAKPAPPPPPPSRPAEDSRQRTDRQKADDARPKAAPPPPAARRPSQSASPPAAVASPARPGPDLAYGAYQRGYFLTAFAEATKRVEEKGDTRAMTLLGELYANGLGVSGDDTKAAQWYRVAADRGDRDAMFALAIFNLTGRAGLHDRAEAARLFAAAAKLGHAAAAYDLGLLYLEGQQFPQDYGRAAELFRFAAEAGNSEAQYALATLYKDGRGVDKDPAEAARYLGMATVAENPDAEVEYAIALFNGTGVTKDETKAAALFRKAALRGNPVAQNRLARILSIGGRGAPANPAEAIKWHLIAKAGGNSDPYLDQFAARQTPDIRAEAEKAARPWLATLPPKS